jgi:arylsulfatase A
MISHPLPTTSRSAPCRTTRASLRNRVIRRFGCAGPATGVSPTAPRTGAFPTVLALPRRRLAAALLALPLIALPAQTLAARARPNIVFILADDLGYGDLRCYNAQSKIPTPNLDRLAAEGMRFTDAHAPDAVCTPTRYGVLTGRYAFRSHLKHGVLRPWDGPLIEEDRLTVPAFLRQRGYATACIGKWHLGWDWPTKDGKPPASTDGLGNVDFARPIANGPTTRGFDSYFGTDVPNYPPYCFIENDRTVGRPSVPAPIRKGAIKHPGPMLPGWNLTNIMPELTRRAVRYVEDAAQAKKPFFLYFPLTAPHYPIVPTDEFKGRSQAGDYGDFVAQVDDTVGQVLSALARTGLATNTLVMFTSDNGPECVEIDPGAYDRIRRYGHWSMDGLRGVKRDIWEGGHRVAFLARWPSHIPAGATSSETICHVDLLATCGAILGKKLPADAGEDSYNILPALLGKKLERPIREATVLHAGNGNFAIRQGDWVLIDARSGNSNGGRNRPGEPAWFKEERGYTKNEFPGELYNLRGDLTQRRNLYGENPEVVQRLKALLEKYQAQGRSTPGPPMKNTPASE